MSMLAYREKQLKRRLTYSAVSRVKPPAEDEAAILADVHPEERSPDRSFTAAAIVLTLGIFVLGIFYHPITDLIEAGVRLI